MTVTYSGFARGDLVEMDPARLQRRMWFFVADDSDTRVAGVILAGTFEELSALD
jgi:hypothetical protein